MCLYGISENWNATNRFQGEASRHALFQQEQLYLQQHWQSTDPPVQPGDVVFAVRLAEVGTGMDTRSAVVL